VAEERFEDAQANKDTPAASAKFQYVWDIRYVHAAVLRDEDTDSGGDCTDEGSERLYYTQDANFNVTALVETDGDVIERYVYDPYGKRTIYDDDWSDEITWANSKKNEILYTGHRLNPESGLYYAGARYYDPVLGCWISWDWTGYADSMNLYAYVSSSPLTRIDPLGLMEKFDTPEKIRKQLGATIEDPSKAVGAGEISTSTTTLTVRVGENVEPGTAKDAQVEYHETVGLIAMRFTGGAGEASKLVVGPRGYIPPSWEETEAEQSGKPYEGVSLPYYDLVQFVTGWHNLAMMVEFAAYARMVKPEEQSPCCYAKLRWGHHGFQPYGGAHVAPPGKTPIPWQENLRGMIRWMCKCEEEGISEPYKYYYSTGVKGLVFKESFNVEIVLKCLANKVAVDTFKMQYWD
jgi:RHS repeat-associated protein